MRLSCLVTGSFDVHSHIDLRGAESPSSPLRSMHLIFNINFPKSKVELNEIINPMQLEECYAKK